MEAAAIPRIDGLADLLTLLNVAYLDAQNIPAVTGYTRAALLRAIERVKADQDRLACKRLVSGGMY